MALNFNPKGLVFLVFFYLITFSGSYAQYADVKELSLNTDKQMPHQAQSKDTLYIQELISTATGLRYHYTDSLAILAYKALHISKKLSFSKGEINARILLGTYYSDKGESEKAISELEFAREQAREAGYQELETKTLNDLANEFGYNGKYAQSLKTYLEGIELAKESNNQVMLSILYENVANVYADQKDYDEALQYYNLVKKINEDLQNDVFMAKTNSNLASVYADMGKLEYAMFHVNKSIATFEKKNIMEWLAYAYEIKGKTYLKEGDFKWSLYWYSQGEMLQKKLHDDRGKIDLYNGIAEAYLGQQQDSLSEDYALRSMALAERVNYKDGQMKCADLLYRLSKKKEDLLCALEYHEMYQMLYDTLSKNKSRMSMELLKTKTAYERQKELLISENDKALAKQRRYINLTLFIMFIIGLIAFLMFRGRKIQERLNVELNAQKDILEEREKQLQESNATKTKLFSIIGHDLRGPIGALQGLLNMVVQGDMSKTEFLDLIPKLRHDIDHISFTLNNLLSWGHTQMNGAITKPGLLTLETIVDENINLLSEQAAGKSIRITSHLPGNAQSWADYNQIDIVLRNLISNAIKFTPLKGKVIFHVGAIPASGKDDSDMLQIKIFNSGIGISKNHFGPLFYVAIFCKSIFKQINLAIRYSLQNDLVFCG